MDRNKSSALYDWEACPPGALRHLAKRLRAARRHQTVRLTSTALAVLLMTAIGAWNVVSHSSADTHYGGISCTDVRASLALYAAGRLPPSMTEQIAEHVRLCPNCAARIKQMRANAQGDARLFIAPEKVARRGDSPILAWRASRFERQQVATDHMLALR